MSKNKLSTDPYKGVRDFFPQEQALLNYMFGVWREVAERFGYVEYGASILEPSELYRAKGVENEEIVNEQTYTFTDRGQREVTLRPEMTPTVARMVAARRRETAFPLRWYSIPNCFRYERPQRGRLREFWQFNADLFGSDSLAADAEIIRLAYELMHAFGASERDFQVRVGSRTYLEALCAELGLDADTKTKFFALLDRKAKMPAGEFADGLRSLGVPAERLDASQPPADVAEVLALLQSLGVTNAVYAPDIVRGFAYYTGVVFEVFDTHPDNNRALFGGGRYDNLTALFDDEPLSAVGCAMGDETMRLFLESRGLIPPYAPPTHVYIAVASPELAPQASILAAELRERGVRVAQDFGDKKLGKQIEAAAKHGVPYLLVVGQDELMAGAFGVRNLTTRDEQHIGRGELAAFFLAQTL